MQYTSVAYNWVDISGSFKFWYVLYVCCIIACDSAPGCLVACAVALSFCIFLYMCCILACDSAPGCLVDCAVAKL